MAPADHTLSHHCRCIDLTKYSTPVGEGPHDGGLAWDGGQGLRGPVRGDVPEGRPRVVHQRPPEPEHAPDLCAKDGVTQAGTNNT